MLALANTINNVHSSDIRLSLSRAIIIKCLHQSADSLPTWLALKSPFQAHSHQPFSFLFSYSHHSFIPRSMNQTWLISVPFLHAIKGQSSYSQLIVHLSPFKSILQEPQRHGDTHIGVLCYSAILTTGTSCSFVWAFQFNVSLCVFTVVLQPCRLADGTKCKACHSPSAESKLTAYPHTHVFLTVKTKPHFSLSHNSRTKKIKKK